MKAGNENTNISVAEETILDSCQAVESPVIPPPRMHILFVITPTE
jgi:hypothetical protein